MAFEIQRTTRSLPGKARAVRANIDVDTGGQLVGQALAGLGGALADIGMKFHLIEADTQLAESMRKSREEINRLALSFQGNLDPSTYQGELQKSVATINSYAPKNRLAARRFGLWVQDRTPQWQLGVEKSRQARITDNFRAEGFNLQQEGIRSGELTKYRLHLWKGYKLGIYSSEEKAKYLQSAIDGYERFSAAEEARLKREQKEALAEAQKATASQLLVDFWNGDLKDPQTVTDALDKGFITDTDAKYLRKALLDTEPAKLDLAVYSKILSEKNKYLANPTKEGKAKLTSLIIKNENKIDEVRGIGLIEDIAKAEDPKAPLSTNRAQIYFGNLTKLWEGKDAVIDDLTFDNKYTKLRNFFHSNPDASAKEASEFYEELTRDVAESLWERIWDWNKRWRLYEIGKRWFGKDKAKDVPGPTSLTDFEMTVRSFRDEGEAKKYYDKWKDRW